MVYQFTNCCDLCNFCKFTSIFFHPLKNYRPVNGRTHIDDHRNFQTIFSFPVLSEKRALRGYRAKMPSYLHRDFENLGGDLLLQLFQLLLGTGAECERKRALLCFEEQCFFERTWHGRCAALDAIFVICVINNQQ